MATAPDHVAESYETLARERYEAACREADLEADLVRERSRAAALDVAIEQLEQVDAWRNSQPEAK